METEILGLFSQQADCSEHSQPQLFLNLVIKCRDIGFYGRCINRDEDRSMANRCSLSSTRLYSLGYMLEALCGMVQVKTLPIKQVPGLAWCTRMRCR